MSLCLIVVQVSGMMGEMSPELRAEVTAYGRAVVLFGCSVRLSRVGLLR